MSKALYSYLLQKHYLPIPGLGSIQVERLPAQTDFVNKQLLPPSFHFRFDKHFDAPDKEFFSFIAAQNNIADFEAIRWYNEWSYNLRNQIRNHKPVTIDGLGILTMDLSGDIRFKPVDTITTFFQPVPALRVSKSSVQHVVVRRGDSEVVANHQSLANQSTVEVPVIELPVEDSVDTSLEIDRTNEPDPFLEEIQPKDPWRRNALILLAACILALFFHSLSNGFKPLGSGNLQSVEITR